jgi:hypothetical protein
MGDNGDLSKATRICKLLIILVAGACKAPNLLTISFSRSLAA